MVILTFHRNELGICSTHMMMKNTQIYGTMKTRFANFLLLLLFHQLLHFVHSQNDGGSCLLVSLLPFTSRYVQLQWANTYQNYLITHITLTFGAENISIVVMKYQTTFQLLLPISTIFCHHNRAADYRSPMRPQP